MEKKIIITEDGSHSLFIPEMDEHYHSTHGAIQESRYVFLKMGLDPLPDKELRILEVGFGTGLNAILTLLAGQKRTSSIHYTSLEKYPLQEKEFEVLNYGEILDAESQFKTIHKADWETFVPITKNFLLKKMNFDLVTDSLPEGEQYDLIYFDAFAPNKQEEMWDEKIFQKIYDAMNPSGVLVTYCAKGVIRRTMQAVGLTMERLPGPPGKRQMLRGTKEGISV